MAKNTGSDYRKGSVKERSQVASAENHRYTKRDKATGRFIAQKADDQPFKGVRNEASNQGNDKK